MRAYTYNNFNVLLTYQWTTVLLDFTYFMLKWRVSRVRAIKALSLSPSNSLVSSWCENSMLTSLLWPVSNSSLFTPALLRTHSFVFFGVQETIMIFLSPFISKASRRVSSFLLNIQLSPPYRPTLLQVTLALISTIFSNIGQHLAKLLTSTYWFFYSQYIDIGLRYHILQLGWWRGRRSRTTLLQDLPPTRNWWSIEK